MNPWTKKSIEIANKQNYLDKLLDVYPMNPEGPRELDPKKWSREWSKNGVPRKKIYPEDFTTKRVQDIWEFKDKPNPIYPTEKNLDMLSRIIQTSSSQGDLVLDTFCGSGGFLFVAEQLQRRWLGMDASKEAIRVSQGRFETSQESMFTPGEIQIFEI